MRTAKRIQIAVLLLLASVFETPTAQAADPTADAKQVKRPYVIGIPVFPNEDAMKAWIKERLPATTLVELEHKKQRVCIALAVTIQ